VTGMKLPKTHLLSCASIILLLVSAAPSFSEVRIELRNGRSVTADYCNVSGKSLLCYKMGGSFEIDRSDVASIKTIEGAGGGEEEGAPPVAGADEGVKKEDAGNKAEVPADDAAGARKSSSTRLEEIRQRKAELAKEREKLVKERLNLQEDMKKAPDWMLPERYDELNKRNADIDARIKKFNEEVTELSNEENKIREEMSPAPPSSPKSGGAGINPAVQ
jgi:hypothetical protein